MSTEHGSAGGAGAFGPEPLTPLVFLRRSAEVFADRVAMVDGDRHVTYSELADRCHRLAGAVAGAGVEPGGVVSVLSPNTLLSLEAHFGVPIAGGVLNALNVRLSAGELAYIVDHAGAQILLVDHELEPLARDVLDRLERPPRLIVAGGDGDEYERWIDGARPAAWHVEDEMQLISLNYTSGTTGRPKGVMWRQADTYVNSMSGADHASADEIRAKVQHGGQPWFAVSPLMHAAGLWMTFAGLLNGIPVILYDKTSFDPCAVLTTAQREKAGMMTIVGDAYARPLVEELRTGDYDLSSLYAIATGGAATNPKYQRALLDLLPQITLINGYGSSETGNVGFGRSQRGEEKSTFELREGALVVSEDYRRFLVAGEEEVGFVARGGRIPLGYFDDEAATRRTFPVVEGRRVVISGDRGSLAADGTLRLFGRDALVVNTGGEKVFVEEVEEVLRAHPAVADALVVGRPSERWGQEVVALVALRAGHDTTPDALHAHCTESLAKFKTPKEFLFVDQVRRLGNGKPDYRWARSAATQQVNA